MADAPPALADAYPLADAYRTADAAPIWDARHMGNSSPLPQGDAPEDTEGEGEGT